MPQGMPQGISMPKAYYHHATGSCRPPNPPPFSSMPFETQMGVGQHASATACRRQFALLLARSRISAGSKSVLLAMGRHRLRVAGLAQQLPALACCLVSYRKKMPASDCFWMINVSECERGERACACTCLGGRMSTLPTCARFFFCALPGHEN